MKGEEKIEIVASTCSKSYFDAVRYHQNMSYKKNNDLTKISNELLVCGKSVASSDMDSIPQSLCTDRAEFSNSCDSDNYQKDLIEPSSPDEELLSILEDK